MEPLTVAQALALARELIPLAEARLLLGHLMGKNHAWLEAHRDDFLETDPARGFAEHVARRAAGEPVAYLLGQREFYGRDFTVSAAVLIPRPETEMLVDFGKSHLLGHRAPAILDLGTGSGCVAISLALEIPGATVTALDLSADALDIARANATQLGASVRFVQGDWFEALGGAETFDLIVGNPPYVAEGDPHLKQGDLRYEPSMALACGSDGLSAIRRIISGAVRHLKDQGFLYLEHGYHQAAAIAELLREAGYRDCLCQRDLAGIERTSGGRRPPAAAKNHRLQTG